MSKYVGFRVGDVHESHVFSEYYCGGCGYPVTDHDSFCPECGGAFRESDASDLAAENAKLVDVLHEVEEDSIYAYHCLQQDCVTITNSSEHFFKKWWHAECELDRAKAENAKLRKLLTFYLGCLTNGHVNCDSCAFAEYLCEHGRKVIDWARELGIEG